MENKEIEKYMILKNMKLTRVAQGDSEEWKQYWKTDLLLVGTLRKILDHLKRCRIVFPDFFAQINKYLRALD